MVQISRVVNLGQEVVTREGPEGDSGGAGHVLFLDLGAGYMGVLTS